MRELESLVRKLVGTDDILEAIDGLRVQVEKLRRQTMALSLAEQAKIDAIQASISSFGAELRSIFDAATSANQALQDHVEQLTAHIDELNALDITEDAEASAAIAALTADRDALQSALDSHSSDVLAGLEGIAGSVDALDNQFGGDAETEPPAEPVDPDAPHPDNTLPGDLPEDTEPPVPTQLPA